MAASVKKQLFTREVVRAFEQEPDFLKMIPDRSRLVNQPDPDSPATINMTDLTGFNVNVLVNNTTYPIPVQDYSDKNIAITLDKFDTENTRVRKDQIYASSLNIIREVTESHSDALMNKKGVRAAHAFAPTDDTNQSKTPVIESTGGNDGRPTGRKRVTPNDIINLKEAFEKLKDKMGKRVLVLCPEHVSDLLKTDENFKEQYKIMKSGKLIDMYGFYIMEYNDMPFYDSSGVKKAVGSTLAPTDALASFCFNTKRAFRAETAPSMFMERAQDSPTQRANVVGFDMRFIALPLIQESIGALISTPV